ncbi:MAG: hypothetical protein ACRCUH_08790 [Shewanella sp.]
MDEVLIAEAVAALVSELPNSGPLAVIAGGVGYLLGNGKLSGLASLVLKKVALKKVGK